MGELNTGNKILKCLFLLITTLCLTLCFHQSVSAAATTTSVRVLTVGKSCTIKNTSKVTSSKKAVATAKKKSSTKYTVKAKKKGVSTLKVYNKKGKLTKKIYLLATNSNSFKYSTSTVNLKKGATKTVKGTSNISGVTEKYSSSNASVATVSSNGKITAKKAGSATISAKFYYKGIKAKTVKKKVNVYTCSYNTDTISLTAGKTKTVAASVSSNCSVKYSSSNASIATVNSSGKITAKKAGTAIITAKVSLGNTVVKTYTKKVKVTAATSTASNNSNSSSSSSASGSSASVFKFHLSTSNVTIKGGSTYSVDAYTEKSTDNVDFVVIGDNIEVKGFTEGTCFDDANGCQCRYVSCIFYGRIIGSCKINVFLNGVLMKTVFVTVTSTDENYFGYESWRKNLEEELWTNSSMSALEKIKAVGNYAFSKYPYNANCDSAYGYYWGCGADCWGSSQLLVDVAHDLGLEAETYFVNGSTYGHCVAKITIDGHTYTLQNSASSSDPYGYVVGG